ncbi:hypothetical protein CFM97_23525 [Klebsiella michiganensis]|uniref:ead/Ea22-like family protein n=1 Tax=Klebsiella michiganensis TaxID=1134687 RepID=UPI001C60A8BC|nr:ead/Ea22-like family protein [Klebsiella michiganensis]MBW5963279.1 hypothetical protein [Klebsiella michiganensis]
MTDITELAQSLKAAAENATPGEWCSDDQYGIVADAGLNGNYYIASCSGPEHRQNKRFIALANPANILALVEALEKAQHEARVDWEAAASLNVENQELKRRIAELESRTAKMPKLKMLEDYLAEVAVEERKAILLGVRMEFHRAINAAGITVEAE